MTIKIDLNTVFLTLEGEPLTLRDNGGDHVATLKSVCIEALLAASQQDTPLQKFENFRMATRFQDSDEIELSAEEVTKLKQRIGQVFPPLYVGNAWMLLDPPAKE